MNDSRAWNNPKIFSLWFLAGIVILFASLSAYVLLTPPLYQSQIIVVESNPCNHKSGALISCPSPSRLIVGAASIGEIRQAILGEHSLPDDTFYEVSARSNSRGIFASVQAESPEVAQQIANELIRQLNILNENHMLEYRDRSLEELTEKAVWLEGKISAAENAPAPPIPTPTPSGYPANYPWRDPGKSFKNSEEVTDLLQEQLDDVNSQTDRLLEGKFEMYEVLEPATYPKAPVPFWKQLP